MLYDFLQLVLQQEVQTQAVKPSLARSILGLSDHSGSITTSTNQKADRQQGCAVIVPSNLSELSVMHFGYCYVPQQARVSQTKQGLEVDPTRM